MNMRRTWVGLPACNEIAVLVKSTSQNCRAAYSGATGSIASRAGREARICGRATHNGGGVVEAKQLTVIGTLCRIKGERAARVNTLAGIEAFLVRGRSNSRKARRAGVCNTTLDLVLSRIGTRQHRAAGIRGGRGKRAFSDVDCGGRGRDGRRALADADTRASTRVADAARARRGIGGDCGGISCSRTRWRCGGVYGVHWICRQHG